MISTNDAAKKDTLPAPLAESTTAMITDIQRFSLQDGPGIRTTVFFKGCNLSCPWCHNPETLSPHVELHYYPARCIGCGHCAAVCPTGAQRMTEQGHVYDRSLCTGCGACAAVCYPGAMTVSGRPMTVRDIMDEAVQDRAYYEDSGGGVTLSGGEVLCQREFAASLARACRGQGIPVAVETNLTLPFEQIADFLGQLDLIMADLKLMDDDAHRRWTGMGNGVILRNLQRLGDLGIPFIVRTPLIPGVTDSDENLLAIADFLKGINGLTFYELLNYNPLGDVKYRSLGRANPFNSARPLDPGRLRQIEYLLSRCGIPLKMEGRMNP